MGMLHVEAEWNGKDTKFEVKVKKRVVLVNKSSSFFKDELFIPWSWWVEKNRWMVFDENEEWFWHHPFWLWVGWIFNFWVKNK
ncbi:hypothetical protein H5410_024548 [Solanum commersonii]|uniref:Phospholipase A1 n=1 Tax=Solanum commersonii TaxID=4109 RepID=A0A9J5ZMA1_SOLCO|nr:hypothetical protein H5410_024548 [Solanum commersonii]